MAPEMLIPLSLVLSLVGALGIALSGARPNLRETVTLVTAVVLALCVVQLLAPVLAG